MYRHQGRDKVWHQKELVSGPGCGEQESAFFRTLIIVVDDDEGEGREVRLITGKIRKILVASGMQSAKVLLEI